MKKIIITLAVIFAAIAVNAQTYTYTDSLQSLTIKNIDKGTRHVDFQIGRVNISDNFTVVFNYNGDYAHNLIRRTADGVYNIEIDIDYDSLFGYMIYVNIYMIQRDGSWNKIMVRAISITKEECHQILWE